MASVLVTGAGGFIGRHVVGHLRKGGYSVTAVTRDSGDLASDSTWKSFPRVNTVIHLAAKSFVPDSWVHPRLYIHNNLLSTVAALGYCRSHGARLIYLSSYLYGDTTLIPIPETAPLMATNPYALSKKLAEETCLFFSDHLAVSITILRPFNVYGPGQSAEFLIPTLLRQVRASTEVRVKDVLPRRDYVYVMDLVYAIEKAVHYEEHFGVFNIGAGVSYSVGELIDVIQDMCSTNLPVISANQRRQAELMNTVADITEARTRLNWFPLYTLREGLKEMFEAERLRRSLDLPTPAHRAPSS